MVNYKSRSSIMASISTYEATIDEAVKTFTISPAITFDTVSKLVLVMDGSFDGAGSLLIGFNGDTANYFTEGTSTVGGTITAVDDGTAASSILGVLAGVEDTFHCNIDILLTKGASADYIHGLSVGNFNGTDRRISIRSNNNHVSITSIEITTSANKWQAGTRFTLYRVNRS